MAILSQLGINETTFYCFLIFVVTFFFLKELLFRPYYLAFEEREKRTKGEETSAKDLVQKTEAIKAEYEVEARDLNAEIKSIFDESRTQANKEYQHILQAARASSEELIQTTKKRVDRELQSAQDQLNLEIPSVALIITKKMLD